MKKIIKPLSKIPVSVKDNTYLKTDNKKTIYKPYLTND